MITVQENTPIRGTEKWLGQARLRYGRNQVVVGIAQKTLESGSNGEKQSKNKLGEIFFNSRAPKLARIKLNI